MTELLMKSVPAPMAFTGDVSSLLDSMEIVHYQKLESFLLYKKFSIKILKIKPKHKNAKNKFKYKRLLR